MKSSSGRPVATPSRPERAACIRVRQPLAQDELRVRDTHPRRRPQLPTEAGAGRAVTLCPRLICSGRFRSRGADRRPLRMGPRQPLKGQARSPRAPVRSRERARGRGTVDTPPRPIRAGAVSRPRVRRPRESDSHESVDETLVSYKTTRAKAASDSTTSTRTSRLRRRSPLTAWALIPPWV